MRVVCKKSWRSIALLLSGMVCGSQLFAQTNPTPHDLKAGDYVFTNFALNPGQTTYPPSMQGWSGTVATLQPTASTTAQATGDEPLCAGCANEPSTINNSDINGISLCNNADQGAFALALAINTTDCFGIQMSWLSVFDAENNDLSASGLQLQYRVGTSGNWNNITGQNLIWSAATFPVDHKDFVAALPAACDNQPVVQLRWVLHIVGNIVPGNRLYVSKIHVMPDSIDGQTGYQRSGGNCDASGANPWLSNYRNAAISQVGTLSGAVTPFTATNNLPGLVNGYSDYTGAGNPVLTVATGDVFDMDVFINQGAVGTGHTNDQKNMAIYIDWNQDFDFSDPDEAFPLTTTGAFIDYVGTITVPPTAKSGYTRMRVKVARTDVTLSPYGPIPDGETEDYRVLVDNILTPLLDCVDRTTYTPKHNAIACMNTDSVRWTAIAGADGYYVTLIEDPAGTPVTLVNRVSTPTASYSLGTFLKLNKTYQFVAEAYDANGTAVNCDTLTFKTSPNLDPSTTILPADENDVCQRNTLQLDGAPLDGTLPLTHAWTGADPALLSSATIPDPVFDAGNKAPGRYGYKYTVTDANGCKASDSVYVSVLEGAKGGSLGTDGTSFCDGDSITLTLLNYLGTIKIESSSSSTGPWSLVTLTNVNEFTFKALATSSVFYRAFVTNGTCLEYSNVTGVTVKPNPTKPIVNPTSATICQGQTTTLSVTNYTTGITWNDAASTQAVDLTTGTAGAYKASTTDNGCTSTSDPVTVTVNAKPATPTITLIGTNPKCDGDSVTLKSSSATNNVWNTSETTQQIVVKSSGDYTVTVTNANNCSATSTPYTMTFNPSPAKPDITATPSGAICAGDSVVLSSSSANNNTWSTGAKTTDITVKAAGNYSVTVKDPSNGCTTKSDVYAVTVNPLPAKPTITASGPLCQGTPVQLNSSASTGNLWSDGSVTNNTTITVDGNYTVTVTDVNGCQNTSNVFKATFTAPPAAPGITQTANTLKSSVTATKYQWYDANGPIAGATGKNYNPTKSGVYYLVVTNAAGCESAASAPFNFSGVGITSYSADGGMKIYPNPNRGAFEVELGSADSGTWTVYDITGRTVNSSDFTGKQISIRENIGNGIYILKVKTTSGEMVQRFEVH